MSPVIINGTLGRADQAELIIANYALALSLFGIIERPVLVFRQTSSALVKGRSSFKMLAAFFIKVTLFISLVCVILGFTPLGEWVFIHAFNAEPVSLDSLLATFRVISLVIIFSGLRCLYQGIIINHLETKWVTIGVIIRLAGMFLVACYFIFTDQVASSMAGAVIFLTGMAIECIASVWRGHSIMKSAPADIGPLLKQKDIFSFYTPLVFYLSFQTVIIPIIYAFLGKIQDAHMGIASFALAFSITNLVLSFFMYTHQIVLQFHENIIVFSIIPSMLLAILCFTPLGIIFMKSVMGTNQILAQETLLVLKFFILKTLVFPWVDYYGGILMLRKNTKSLLKPQLYNMAAVIVCIVPLVYLFPEWNGSTGAIAASAGELVGLLAVYLVVTRKDKALLEDKRNAG
jgi:Na+-driven multidrug efflux pump